MFKNIKKLEKKKGYCEVCNEPLGQTSLSKTYCYQCSGFEKVDIQRSIIEYKKKLDSLRNKFKKTLIDGDILKYLETFLDIGEGLLNSELQENVPVIPSKGTNPIISYNLDVFVAVNIAIKWILEDSLSQSKSSTNPINVDIAKIIGNWLKYYKEFVYLENDLGFVIVNDIGEKKFYYLKILYNYYDSLYRYGVFSTKDIGSKKYNQILDKLYRLERNVEKKKQFAQFNFRLYLLSKAYDEYPNNTEKLFSFENILNDEFSVKELSIIYNFYNDKRGIIQEDLNKGKHHFVKRTYQQFLIEFSSIPWQLVSGQYNFKDFPFLIDYNNHIYITPTRLKLANIFLQETKNHNDISSKLSKEFEINFQKQVESILRRKQIDMIDEVNKNKLNNIIDKKENSFEIDILAYYDNLIFIIECKSFHFSPFYYLKTQRLGRKKDQFDADLKKFNNKRKPWLLEQLKQVPKNNNIQINCRQIDRTTGKSHSIKIHLPKKYHNITQEKIIGLYITQLDEYFNKESNLIQIYIDDLEEFFDEVKKKF